MIRIIRFLKIFFIFLLIMPVVEQCSDQDKTLNQKMINLVKYNKGKLGLAIFSIAGIFLYRRILRENAVKYFKLYFQKDNDQSVSSENDNNEDLNLNFLFGETHPLCQCISDNNLCVSKSDLRAMLNSEKIIVDDTMTKEQKILFESVMRCKDIFESEDELLFPLAFDDNSIFLPIALLIEYASNAIIFTDLDIADQFKNEMHYKNENLKYYFKEEIFQKEEINDSKKCHLLTIFLHFFKEHIVQSENIHKSLEVFTSVFNFPVFDDIYISKDNEKYAFLYDMYKWYTSQEEDFIEKNVANVDKNIQETLVYFQYAFHLLQVLQEGNETLLYNYCLDEFVDKIVSIDSDEKAIEILSYCFNYMFNYGFDGLERIFLQNKVRFFIFNRILMGEPRWGGPMDVDIRYDYDETKAPWYNLFVENVYNLLAKQRIDNNFWHEYTDFWFNYCFPYHFKTNDWKFIDKETIHPLVFQKILSENLNAEDLKKKFELYRNSGYVFSKFLSKSWSNIDCIFFENKEKIHNFDDIKYHKLILFKKWSELLFFSERTYEFVDNIDFLQTIQDGINSLMKQIQEIKKERENIKIKFGLSAPMLKGDVENYKKQLNLAKSNLEIAKSNNANVLYFERQITDLTNCINKLNKENEETQFQRNEWKKANLKSESLGLQLEDLRRRLNVLIPQCFISHIFFSLPSSDQVKIASNLLCDNSVIIKNIDTSLHLILLKKQLEKENKNFDFMRNVLRERIQSKNSKNLLHDLVGDVIKKRGQDYSFNYIASNLWYLFSDDQKTLNKFIKKAEKLYNFVQDSDVKKMLKDVIWELSIYLDYNFENKHYTSMRDFILYQSESTTDKLNELSKNMIEKTENYIINTIFSDNDDVCNEKQKVKLLLYATYNKAMCEEIKKRNVKNALPNIQLYCDFMFNHQKNEIGGLNLKHEELFGENKLIFEKNCPYPIFNPMKIGVFIDSQKFSEARLSDRECNELGRYLDEYRECPPCLLGRENMFVKDLLLLKN